MTNFSIRQIEGDLIGLNSTPLAVNSAVDYTVTNPCPAAIDVIMTAASKKLYLPAMNTTNSLRTGQSISISNSGTYTFDIYLDDNTLLYTAVPCSSTILLYLVTASDGGEYLQPITLNGERIIPVSVSAPYTIQSTDMGKTFIFTAGVVLSLNQLSTYPSNFYFNVINGGNFVSSVNAYSGDTINGNSQLNIQSWPSCAQVCNVTSQWLTKAYTPGGFNSSGILKGSAGGTGVNNGSYTLTLTGNTTADQDVSSAGSPSFVGATLSGLSASEAVVTDGSKNLASLAYTNANTANTLVERDSSGNFSAGTITANLTGAASQVGITNTGTNATFFIPFVSNYSTGNYTLNAANAVTFNPSLNYLQVAQFRSYQFITIGVASTGTGSLNMYNVGSAYGSTIQSSGSLAQATTFTLPAASFSTANLVDDTSTQTLTNKTWNGVVVGSTYGGTGVNNGSSTITLGGSITFSGAHTFTGTLTADTSVTFPTSGTLATTTQTITNVNQNTSSATLAANTRYVTNNGASLVTYTLPTSATIGDTYIIVGGGSGNWTIAQNSGQQISVGSSKSTGGTGGSVSSSGFSDCTFLTCTATNTAFACYGIQGNLTIV